MKLVKGWADALWDAVAKIVMPDSVLRFENLHMTPGESERARLLEAAEWQHMRRLRATWSVTESFDDMAVLFEPEHQLSGGRLRCLAVSGSLRSASTNTAILRAAARLAPAQMAVELYGGLAGLPLFNPDLDIEPVPAPVVHLRQEVRSSHVLVISSPAYAHGVPGSLKNALDWLVRGHELQGLPVAVLSASSHVTQASAALIELLRVMGARIVPEACLTLPAVAGTLSDVELVMRHDVSSVLLDALSALVSACDTGS